MRIGNKFEIDDYTFLMAFVMLCLLIGSIFGK